MRLYNTLTRRVEEFTPLEPGHVRMYNCGPTVYRRNHLGNYRAYATADLLRRLGDALGRRVRLLPIPPSALRLAMQTIGRGAEAERLLESFRVDSTAIRRELAWTPPFTVAQGLADTVRWWLSLRAAA